MLGPFVNDEYSDVTFAVYAVKAKGVPPRALTREAEALRQRLLHVPGVKKVNIFGERPERIFVEFSYSKLATLGISARSIFDALNRQNVVTPAGSIDTNGPQVVRSRSRARSTTCRKSATRRSQPVAACSSSPISPRSKRGYEDPATFLIRHDGDPAMVLGVVMQDGWNGLELGQGARPRREAAPCRTSCRLELHQGDGSGGQHPRSRRRVHAEVFVALAVVMIVSFVEPRLAWSASWSPPRSP